jgi:pimeloyl-ACP methyl ester carboxylesterase
MKKREVDRVLRAAGRITHEERLDVAGNSMGGAIAELYAQRYPGEVRSVAFLGAPFGYTSLSEWLHDLMTVFSLDIGGV